MNQSVDTHAANAPQPKLGDPPNPPPSHTVALTTSLNGNTIAITGDGGWNVPAGQPATHFNFTLTDTSGANVQFASLDAADNMTTCPPPGSGNGSGQIVGVTMNNNGPNKSARFTDNNSNPSTNGPMNVSYQWNFSCDPTHTVQSFDPIISNGGRVTS
jgi:hypothetical protein